MKGGQYILLLVAILLSSCNNENGIVSRQEKDGDKAYTVEAENDEMNKASEEARRTYDQFVSELKQTAADTSKFGFAVKMKFEYGEEGGEHMWLNQLFFRDDKMLGVLDNEPFNATQVKIGDTVEIKRNAVSDWIYFSNDTLKGGYTVRVLYKYATPDEKKELEASYGQFVKDGL